MQQSSLRSHRPALGFAFIGFVVSTVLLALLVREVIRVPLLAQALTWGVFWFTSVQALRSLRVGEYLCGAVVRMGVSLFGGLVGWRNRGTWFVGRMWAIDRRGTVRIGRPGTRANLALRVAVFGQVSPGDLGHIESL